MYADLISSDGVFALVSMLISYGLIMFSIWLIIRWIKK